MVGQGLRARPSSLKQRTARRALSAEVGRWPRSGTEPGRSLRLCRRSTASGGSSFDQGGRAACPALNKPESTEAQASLGAGLNLDAGCWLPGRSEAFRSHSALASSGDGGGGG